MLWNNLFSLFFPRLCKVCGRSLVRGEELLCLGCMADLPRSFYWLREENPVKAVFTDMDGMVHASSFLRYTKESPYHCLLHQLKYEGAAEVGQLLGQWFGEELKQSTFYSNIDMIVPVPLHPKKERKRGYNQSLMFAQGIAAQASWQLAPNLLQRTRHTATQTRLNKEERRQNIAGAFSITKPETATGKHILLVDDVLTTGATIQACAAELLKAPGCKISIATLAYIE